MPNSESKSGTRGLTMSFDVAFTRREGRQKITPKQDIEPAEIPKPSKPKIPRVVQLLALAHHYDDLLRKGVVKDYADIARLGGVSRARITQIMGLLLLAPEIQEELLGSGEEGPTRDIPVRDILPLLGEKDWRNQISLWKSLKGGVNWASLSQIVDLMLLSAPEQEEIILSTLFSDTHLADV
jgi:hypothetical protein